METELRYHDLRLMDWSPEMIEVLQKATKGKIKDLRMINFILDELEKAKKLHKRGHTDGVIYIVSEGSSFYKIGKSKDHSVINRLVGLQVGNPRPLSFVQCYYCSDYHTLEFAVHSSLEKHKISGEWFEIDLKNIKRTIINCAKNNDIIIFGELGASIVDVKRNLSKLQKEYQKTPEERYKLFLKEGIKCMT